MQDSLVGTIEHIIYRNEDNGYTVFSLNTDGEELTCVGVFTDIREGLTIEAEGHMTEHAAYGMQLKVERYSFRTPEDIEGIERYLGSGAIKGIGKALASRITVKFGMETLRIMEEEPERLAEVRGISEMRAREIAAQFSRQAGMRKAMMFLQDFGISQTLGVRIYKEYGEEMYDILRNNPYRMAEDIDGIGFLTADRIAARAGISSESEFRIRSGLLFVLIRAAADGSVYLPEPLLLSRASVLLGVPEEMAEHALHSLAMEHRVVLKALPDGPEGESGIAVYAGRYYYLELNAARMLLDLNGESMLTEEEITARIEKLESSGDGIVLADEQKKAVITAARNGVLILTGGPGTGKTTTINEIIRFFRQDGRKILLAAPTGRAAKRITETTGYEALTIHRLLEISSQDDLEEHAHFERNETNPLEADVIIIDEMSMVDIFLLHSLLSAVAEGTKLILVGDVNQLPSVGPGAVLRDLISSGAFPCVTLTRIFRQAQESDIVVNAHKINDGEQPLLTTKSRDFFFLKREDANRIISNTIELVRDRLPGYVGASPFDIQVLTPMRKGVLGVERLNRIMQEYLNPKDDSKKEKLYGDRLFRTGDKIMQIRNNYQLEWEVRSGNGFLKEHGSGIFNGDMGVIREISDFTQTLSIEFDEGRMVQYPYQALEELEHAYAITIHKSQGSEYPAVVLPVLSGPKMLMTRNLLYTAVTRAKNCVVILGSEEAVRDMVGNKSEQQRFTSLDERIREICRMEE
jgi:exodeoxyribonuclease V alpha subunit